MKILFWGLFCFAYTFTFPQNLDDCENWFGDISYPVSYLHEYKVIQDNPKYGFQLILVTEPIDSSLLEILNAHEYYTVSTQYPLFLILDTKLDSAYILSETFFDDPAEIINKKNEWNVKTSIFSPDGNYTSLKFFHFGGIPIIKTSQLRLYLQKKATAQFCIDQNEPGYGPSPIHRVIGWKNNTKLIYGWGCCGTSFTGEYDIMKRKTKQLGEVNSWKDNEE